jgi:hypothetical protein
MRDIEEDMGIPGLAEFHRRRQAGCTVACNQGRRCACAPADDFAFPRPLVLRWIALALLALLIAAGSAAWKHL